MSDQPPDEIGRVVLADGEPFAILRGDRAWECPGRPGLAEMLSVQYRDAYRGPSDGRYGPRILAELAANVGGLVVLAPAPPGPYRDRAGHGIYLGADLGGEPVVVY
jgi:hypothetical protein